MGTYVHTRFSYNDGDTSYAGVHIPSERWNGWACPSFPLGECVRMLADMSKDQDAMEIGYRVSEGVIQFEDGTGWQVLAGHVVDGVEVFAVGSWGWVWDEIDQACPYCGYVVEDVSKCDCGAIS
jgi:hypothetical protein